MAAAEIVNRVDVKGTQRIEASTVASYLGIRPGDDVGPNEIDRGLKSLYATGLFSDISIYTGGDGVLYVELTENPVINEIAFEGNDKLKDADLESEVQSRSRMVFTRTKVQSDVERILELYRLSGRFSAKVEPKIIKLDQNRVNLVFEIDEGPKTRIRKVNFIGNKAYGDDKLRDVIRSKEAAWYRFLSSDDNYDPERLNFDRELLRRYYLNHGYADFRIDSAVAELAPDKQGFYLTYTIEEGERYKVGDVVVNNNTEEMESGALDGVVVVEKDKWYDASKVERSVSKLTDAAHNAQQPFVDVRPRVDRNRDEKTVDLTFNVNEGQKNYVERVNVSGNVRTLDEVVRREMVLAEGDPLNASKLKESETAIRDLDYFEKVTMTTEQGSSPEKTVVNIDVSEKSTGQISIGAGFSSNDGPLADFSISERNFLGKGQQVALSTTLSGKRSEFDFSFTEPYFAKRDLSAGFDLFHITRDLQEESSYDREQTGGGLRIGYPLAEHWRQNLGYRLENNKITDVKPTASFYIRSQEGERLTSAINQRLTYDTRDSILDPTEGFIGRVDTELAGLGGDARYVRVRGGGTYYYPVADQWILSLLAEAGAVRGYGDEDVQINERFFIGGDQLRGFANSGIGPRDITTEDALGGNTFGRASAEIEFPSGLPEELGIRGRLFSDVGTLFDIDSSGAGLVDDASIRASVGAGVSWRSPLGPVRVDLAMPVVKEDFDETEAFRFSFGTRF